jgi:hypothetical protein
LERLINPPKAPTAYINNKIDHIITKLFCVFFQLSSILYANIVPNLSGTGIACSFSLISFVFELLRGRLQIYLLVRGNSK